MEPTVLFHPFGHDGPRVAVFGAQTGDWSMKRLQEKGDQVNEPYARLNRMAKKFDFKRVFIPSPTDCNTLIAEPENFTVGIHNGPCSLEIRRGVMADGVVLRKGHSGAIASADCPTIIAYCPVMKTAIIGHGGSKSLIDVQHVLYGKDTRTFSSVVDAIVSKMDDNNFCCPQVFVTCGIRNYHWPSLATHLSSSYLYRGAVNGKTSINLIRLIADQFASHGIKSDVTTDTIDTFSDMSGYKDYKWHSHRRGTTDAEKSRRNLVLVVNE